MEATGMVNRKCHDELPIVFLPIRGSTQRADLALVIETALQGNIVIIRYPDQLDLFAALSACQR
jgi:hypothetical protein